MREYARQKQVPLKKETLFLAGWILLLTNVPEEMLSLEEAATLRRVRWQVEILFRVWKSQVKVDEWRSENPWRILCEIYGKFIAIVITHWLLLLEWPRLLDMSLSKAVQAVQKLALPFALALRYGGELERLLELLQRCFRVACRQNKRRKEPATFQLLLALESRLT